MRDYGYNLGLAFQLVDDILDFTGQEEEMGKPIGSDLSHGILTLPAILLVERHPQDNPVQTLFESRNMEEDLKSAIDMIHNSSIIEECYTIISSFCDQAHAALESLPDNKARQSLTDLIEYVTRRRS